jgi:fermentation-respiration switch protein FrsA (DUF1100 family)
MIIHGKLDPVVPFSNALELEKNLHAPHESLFIADGDHNLTRDADIALLKGEVPAWLLKHSRR